MMKPEPKAVALRFMGLCLPCCCMNCWKNCSKGEPFGKSNGMSCWASAVSTWVEEMLTTAGVTLDARSAKLAGTICTIDVGLVAALSAWTAGATVMPPTKAGRATTAAAVAASPIRRATRFLLLRLNIQFPPIERIMGQRGVSRGGPALTRILAYQGIDTMTGKPLFGNALRRADEVLQSVTLFPSP